MANTFATTEDYPRLTRAQAMFGAEVRLSEPFALNPPLWIEPASELLRSDIAAVQRWMAGHHEAIEEALLTFGAIVWRGFPVSGSDDFAALMSQFEPYAQGYAGGTSDRKPVKGQVMEATRTPPEATIPLHQEMSYMPASPRALAFYCKLPSLSGGETVICDMRGLLGDLPEDLRAKFIKLDVEYVRNMRSQAVDDWRADPALRHPSWQYRFETSNPAEVEAQLTQRGAQFAWNEDGTLSFWTRVPGVITHPVTGDLLYFNQTNSQVQHRLTVGDERARLIESTYGDTAPRPYSVRFSGGEPLLEVEFLAIHRALESRKLKFPWQAGDIMVLDNKLTAHGRHPFTGPRDVQVMLFQ